MTPRPWRLSQRTLIYVVAALLGAGLAAEPTGVTLFDVLWSAAFVGVLASAGAFASPLTLLPAGTAAALLSGRLLGLLLAGASIGAAVATAGQARPSSRLTAVSGGLLGLAVLQRGPGSTLSVLGGGTLIVLVVLGSGWRGLSRRRRRRITWTYAVGAVAIALLGAVGVAVGLSARSEADRGIDVLRSARVAATAGDLEAARTGFRDAEVAFRAAAERLSGLGGLARVVPGVSQQIGAAATSVDTAADVSGVLREVVSSIRLEDVAVTGGAIDLAAVSATEPGLQTAADALLDGVVRLSRIERTGLLPPIRDALDDALDEARAAAGTVDRAHRAVRELPWLLGGERPTRYLVLFTSGVEARNRFGFPGAYAMLHFDAGRLSFEQSGSVADLVPPGGYNPAALTVPQRAEVYGAYEVSRDPRSVTIPPDGPTVAELAIQMVDQSGLGTVDGVVLADPQALAQIMRLTGDVPVPGLDTVLTPDNVVDYIVREQYLAFPRAGEQRERKDALAVVAELVGQRLGQLELDEVRDVAEAFGPLVADGRLVVAVPATDRPTAATLLADLRIDGGLELPSSGADLLLVGHVNNVGNKIDLFLERSLEYRVDVDAEGDLSATLGVDLRNRAPASGLPDYLIGSALVPPPPRGTNITTVLITSRHRMVELAVDGEPLVPLTLVDGGLIVYQLSLEIAPGGSRRIDASFEGVAPPEGYALQLHPNGLVIPDQAVVEVHDDRDDGRIDHAGPVERPLCLQTDRSGVPCPLGSAP